ncbi:permease-like cell division protein FtsX [Zhihengliuella salsuginis]|uniref:Cell division protein FtsX n=1 Tax=Zhihengliuella salsuginis TaxID=578222 RepID=A0ABQ3GIF1_9MICC|nr:permease-like cell division protein FtsX [Zhihengliuella salsuginis]GHD08779.1 cell division protein FtsX [Zhihengliuella salsuginis]
MRLAFILSEIGSGLRRNLSMVVSVVLVTFVSLSFIGGAALLQMQINQMKDYWYDKVQVSIFLCADNSSSQTCAAGAVTDEQRADIESKMESPAVAQYVESYQHETQDEALTHFQDQFENSPIVDTVTADQLPESFRVRLVDPEKYEVINELFSSMTGVDVVVDQRELLEQIFSIMNVASLVSLGIAGVMIVCAVLLVATTIRLSAFSRRRETGIMRLVGASKLVIQLPFVLEGVIAAVIGAMLASGALWAVARFFIEGQLAQQYPGTAFIASSQVWVIAPVLVILGALLAGISSMLTLRRYLKV